MGMRTILIRSSLPFLEGMGEEICAQDSDDEGNDDLAGQAMIYTAQVCQAVLDKSPTIPLPPDILLRGGKPAKKKPGDAGQGDNSGSAVTKPLPKSD